MKEILIMGWMEWRNRCEKDDIVTNESIYQKQIDYYECIIKSYIRDIECWNKYLNEAICKRDAYIMALNNLDKSDKKENTIKRISHVKKWKD